MNHGLHDLISVQFIRSLRGLKGMLGKATEFAEQRKFDPNSFLQLRLAPDMFPFVRQIQIATDGAKGAASRLTGKPAPSFPDEEKTIPELMARIDKTIEYLNGFKPEDFRDYEGRTMAFPWNPGAYLKGADYLSSHALPNFYFHVATAYNILRLHGVQLGKGDYLGEQNWNKN